MRNQAPRIALLGLAASLAAPAAFAAEMGNSVDINAYLDLEYRETTFGRPPMDLDGFRQAHATVLFTARPSDDTLVHLRLETAYGAQADTGEMDDTGQRFVGTGSITVHGAYAQWTPTPQVRLRAGRLLTPWGFYNEIHDASPTYPSVHLPFVIYHPQMMGGFDSYQQAVTGVSAAWMGGLLRGQVMLSNGTVELGNEAYRDDNHSRGVLLRLDTDPIRPVSGNFSGYYSKVGPEGLEQDLFAGIGALRTGFGQWQTTTEATYGNRAGQSQLGATTEVEATHFRRVTPFVRGEVFNGDLSTSNFAYIGVGGIKVALSTGHVIFKIDHLTVFKPYNDGSGGEFRAAVVGWF